MKKQAVICAVFLFSVFVLPNTAFASENDLNELDGAKRALFVYVNNEWSSFSAEIPTYANQFDYDNDGVVENIIGGKIGDLPIVRINNQAGEQIAEFLAYDQGMLKGFDLVVADIDGDGSTEIITSAGIGTNGHVRILNKFGEPKFLSRGLFPFGQTGRSGAVVKTADLDGDGIQEILVGSGPGIAPRIQIWAIDGRGFLGEFAPFDDESKYGVSLATGDYDGDGKIEIAVSMLYGGDGRVRIFDRLTFGLKSEFMAFGTEYQGGVRLTNQPSSGDGYDLLAVEQSDLDYSARPLEAQYVIVNISEQRLYAYEYGQLVNTFLVSTGRYGFDTPIGDFSALAKPEYVHYKWSYGENHKENYDLGLVRWNIRIYPHIYIHQAPWHNGFGRRMSHGCINVRPAEAEWIYNWINVGAPVKVQL